jgi:hypothetical protein
MSIIRRWRFPLAISLLLLLLTGRVHSVTDSGGSALPGIAVRIPADYIALSPLYRTLDALTLLSTQQAVALIVSVAILLILWLTLTRHRIGRPLWKRIAIALPVFLVVVLALEAAAAYLPRGMLSIRATGADVMIVDFHGHTGTSHDVRKSITAEHNRRWHEGGGFDIAYITDHVKFAGAVAGRANNPARAGDGTSLLTGVEGRYHRIISTIVIGLTEKDSALFNKRGNLLSADYASGRAPVTMIALPSRNLDSLTVEVLDSAVALPSLAAIELIDAAPRGLAQVDRQEQRIRDVAARLGLELVAASNNHGYGRTVAGWNLLRVPGWRAMTPDSAGTAIEDLLRQRNAKSVEIAKRTRPALHGYAVAGIAPFLAYQVVGALTLAERIIWIAWTWVIAIILSRLRRKSQE